MAEIVCPYCGMLNYTFSDECQNCHRPLVPPPNSPAPEEISNSSHVSPFENAETPSNGEEPEWIKAVRQRRDTEIDSQSHFAPKPGEINNNDDDWLNQIRNLQSSAPEPSNEKPPNDWLDAIHERMSEDGIDVEPNQSLIGSGMTEYLDPYWLKKLREAHEEELGEVRPASNSNQEEILPEWLARPATPEALQPPASVPPVSPSPDRPWEAFRTDHPGPSSGTADSHSSQPDPGATQPLPIPEEDASPYEFPSEEENQTAPAGQTYQPGEIEPNRSVIGTGFTSYLDPFYLKKLEEIHQHPFEENPPEPLTAAEEPVLPASDQPVAESKPEEPLAPEETEKPEITARYFTFDPDLQKPAGEPAKMAEPSSSPADFQQLPSFLHQEDILPPKETVNPAYTARTMFLHPENLSSSRELPAEETPPSPAEPETPKPAIQPDQPYADLLSQPAFLAGEQPSPEEDLLSSAYYARTMSLNPDHLSPQPGEQPAKPPAPAAPSAESQAPSFLEGSSQPSAGLNSMPAFLAGEQPSPEEDLLSSAYYARTMSLNPDHLSLQPEGGKTPDSGSSTPAGDLTSLFSQPPEEPVQPNPVPPAAPLEEASQPEEVLGSAYFARTNSLNPDHLPKQAEEKSPESAATVPPFEAENIPLDLSHIIGAQELDAYFQSQLPLPPSGMETLPGSLETTESPSLFSGFGSESQPGPDEKFPPQSLPSGLETGIGGGPGAFEAPAESASPFDFSFGEDQSPFHHDLEGQMGTIPAESNAADIPPEDWLKNLRGEPEPEEATPSSKEVNLPFLFPDEPAWTDQHQASTTEPAQAGDQELAPAELPGWVQAMRPSESNARHFAPPPIASPHLAGENALSGIEGALPAEPLIEEIPEGPSYSVNLNLTDKQRAQAEIFRKMLAARTIPYKADHEDAGKYSRPMRWILAGILVVAILLITFYGTGSFNSPAYYPQESVAGYQVLKDVPVGSTLLVTMDYSPAYSGEIEAAILPMINQLYHNGDHLVFLATTSTGSALVDQLMNQVISSGAYPNLKTSEQIFNLGYLPGGSTALLSLSRDLQGTVPNLANGQPAWQNPALKNIRNLSGFSAILLLTDNAESARSWAEQVLPSISKPRFVVATSSQAAPFIRPFYESGQLSGLITGMEGGMTLEKLTGTIQKAGMYWGTYEAGILIVILLIVAGIILNLSIDRMIPSGSRKKG